MSFVATLPGGANGFFQADACHNAPSVGCFAVASFRLCNYLRFGLLDVFCGHPYWRGQWFFPGSCWLQGSVSQVFAVASFGFYRFFFYLVWWFSFGWPRIFEGVSLNRARLRKRITVAIFNVGETPSRRANLRVFHNRLKNKKINTIIILIIIEIKNTLIN